MLLIYELYNEKVQPIHHNLQNLIKKPLHSMIHLSTSIASHEMAKRLEKESPKSITSAQDMDRPAPSRTSLSVSTSTSTTTLTSNPSLQKTLFLLENINTFLTYFTENTSVQGTAKRHSFNPILKCNEIALHSDSKHKGNIKILPYNLSRSCREILSYCLFPFYKSQVHVTKAPSTRTTQQ